MNISAKDLKYFLDRITDEAKLTINLVNSQSVQALEVDEINFDVAKDTFILNVKEV